MRKTTMICLLFCISFASATHGAGLGRVIWFYAADLAASRADSYDAQSPEQADLVETNLNTGKRTVLARDMRRPDDGFVISPNGRYLALHNRPNILDGDKPSGGLTLWDRKTGKASDIYPDYRSGKPIWSKSGRYLAIPDTTYETLKVYDVSARHLLDFPQYRRLITAQWSAKSDELIVEMPARGKRTVYAQPISGKQRRLLRWSLGIDGVFGDGSGFASWDGASVYSYGPSKKRVRVPIHPARNNPWEIEFAAQLAGRKMAALASYNYGEPHLNYDYALYVFTSGAAKVKRIAKWSESYLSSGPTDLVGWLTDGSAIVVRLQAGPGYEAASWRGDRWTFKAFAISGSQPGKLIFDSGPGCLAAVWWPG